MNVLPTSLEGVFLISPHVHGDARGYFLESYNLADFEKLIGPVNWVQDNESRSSRGVLRGIHFQKPPYAQAKLVRVTEGSVLDVAVDLRRSSPTFGRWTSAVLSGDNHLQMFLPKGIGHGFLVLSDSALFQYKCDEFYHPESEGAIVWNDPDLAIDWGADASQIVLSPKDAAAPLLRELPQIFG